MKQRPIKPNRANTARARELRGQMSRAEKHLWYDCLNRDRLGVRFRRQHPIGPYVLDFYSPAAKLCVEVDGDQHERRLAQDAARDAYLLKLGIRTIRFCAYTVLIDLGTVRYRIEEVLRERLAPEEPPAPPEAAP